MLFIVHCDRIKTVIQMLNEDVGKLEKPISLSSAEGSHYLSSQLAKAIHKYNCKRIVFDTHGEGLTIKERFIGNVASGIYSFIIDEKGNILFKGEESE